MSNGNRREVTLLYVAQGEHLFREELEALVEKDDPMTAHFIHEREAFTRTFNQLVGKYGPGAYYYLSGTMGMINDFRGKLKRRQVPGKMVIFDPFLGY